MSVFEGFLFLYKVHRHRDESYVVPGVSSVTVSWLTTEDLIYMSVSRVFTSLTDGSDIHTGDWSCSMWFEVGSTLKRKVLKEVYIVRISHCRFGVYRYECNVKFLMEIKCTISPFIFGNKQDVCLLSIMSF